MSHRTEINGLIVSTVLTYDMGWETAIVDAKKARPVERYGSEEQATAGHERWCRWAADDSNTRVHQLGWVFGVGEGDFELERRKVTFN
jgi:hypothetical protein